VAANLRTNEIEKRHQSEVQDMAKALAYLKIQRGFINLGEKAL